MKSHIMHTMQMEGARRDLGGSGSENSARNGKTEAVNDKVFARMCLDVRYTVRQCRMNICIRVDYGDILMTVKNEIWVDLIVNFPESTQFWCKFLESSLARYCRLFYTGFGVYVKSIFIIRDGNNHLLLLSIHFKCSLLSEDLCIIRKYMCRFLI